MTRAADRYAHWAARPARGEILGVRLMAASGIVLVLAGTTLTWPSSNASGLAPRPPRPPVVRTSPPPTTSGPAPSPATGATPPPPTTNAPPPERPVTQATASATTATPGGNLPEPAANERPPASVAPPATAGPPATTTRPSPPTTTTRPSPTTTTRAPPPTTRPPRNPAKGLPDADGIRICYRTADGDIKIQQPCRERR